MLTQTFSLRSSRVVYARACRTRPTRGVTSPTPLAVPPAKVPWLLRPPFLLRIHVTTKAALVRGSPRVPMQPRAFMPQFLPHHQRNALGPFTIPKIRLFQHRRE